MAISGVIEFHVSSGAPSHPFQLDPFVAGSGLEWNRIAFLGVAGEGSYLIVNNYQDKTYVSDEDGRVVLSSINAGEGELQNLKYVNDDNCDPNASGTTLLTDITEYDATLRIRFTEPSGQTVTTSNGKFRCVTLGATSGVADEAAVESNILMRLFEVGRDSAWTFVSDDASVNYITVADRAVGAIVHDFHIGITAAPNTTGEKIDFGFLFTLEFV